MRSWESSHAPSPDTVRGAALAAAVGTLDVATKRLAESELGEPVALFAGARLEVGHNSGIAFGGLAGLPWWVLVLATACVLLGLLTAVRAGRLPIAWPALGLLLGGALGNVVDRVGDGRVTDFIDPPRWPAFNVADIAITCSIALILWQATRDDGRRQA